MDDRDNKALVSPLTDNQSNLLQQAITELSPQQLAWASGYFWGVAQSGSIASASNPTVQSNFNQTNVNNHEGSFVPPAIANKLTIIYASQTGNAKGVAEALKVEAEQSGIETVLFDASDYKGKNLAKETHVVIVASTNGEGEAPDNSIDLHDFLQSKKAPKLPNLNYAVLALGDSSYEFFCQTGKDFDSYLSKLGATHFIERLDCDVDYNELATAWRKQVVSTINDLFESQQYQANVTDESQTNNDPSLAIGSSWSKSSPYTSSTLINQKITGRDSDKDVRHIELDLEGSGLTYQPGDALGVWYKNSSKLVTAILDQVGLDKETIVTVDDKDISIEQALTEHYEITIANPQFITQYASLTSNDELTQLVVDKAQLREYVAKTQIIDVLKSVNNKPAEYALTGEQLLSLLRRLTPRLYSIASSQEEVGEEVHLTLGVVQYEQDNELRLGGASGYLSQLADDDEEVKVFIEHNNHFKLPEDDNKPVIMIGPGTGIAPFRAFMQQREATEAQGKNWLFFGERTFTQDFLYQVEWQKYLKSGLLTKLDLAFSRDQSEKIYVQDRLIAQAEEVWAWLQAGAYIYVCGDANRMAKDVHNTLIQIAEQQGQLTNEQAQEFINELRKAKRYQKDVY